MLLVEAELVLDALAAARVAVRRGHALVVALRHLADAVVHQVFDRREVAVERRARDARLLHQFGDGHLRPVLASGEIYERGKQAVLHLLVRELSFVHETHHPVLSPVDD